MCLATIREPVKCKVFNTAQSANAAYAPVRDKEARKTVSTAVFALWHSYFYVTTGIAHSCSFQHFQSSCESCEALLIPFESG
jgi:hypothetical protein